MYTDKYRLPSDKKSKPSRIRVAYKYRENGGKTFRRKKSFCRHKCHFRLLVRRKLKRNIYDPRKSLKRGSGSARTIFHRNPDVIAEVPNFFLLTAS